MNGMDSKSPGSNFGVERNFFSRKFGPQQKKDKAFGRTNEIIPRQAAWVAAGAGRSCVLS
jgi:hypothetical protein